MKLQRNAIVRSFIIISLILSLLLSGGCNKQQANEPQAGADTITITDCIGRQVNIPSQINRIACLCPESGYALAMFGKGDKIVAVVGGLQRDLILTDMYPAIKGLPVPKGSAVINIEELVKTKPDVVFVKSDTSSSEAETEKLNKSKIPFLVVEFNNMKGQQDAIEMIGKVVGATDKAGKYNAYYQKCIDRVQERVAGIPQEKRVKVYHSLNEAIRTDIKGSLSGDWMQAAGAFNVSANENLRALEGKYFASLEQILLWNPDVILVNEGAVVNYIYTNKQWSPLKAVKNKQVLQLPNGISRWGHPSSPETPLAVLWTAKTIYPDKFADLDMVAETKYFYKEFFSLELSDEVVNKIIFGEGMRIARQ
ncbi:MAG: iron ABC transporter substrate-binding protein [Firmicutes bacterium HGW-Firmicutes-15]|nr:MAG: iron ABC transporter substrate-binding protein [Firmicutes bacterium HGW-Firmicutes-15]